MERQGGGLTRVPDAPVVNEAGSWYHSKNVRGTKPSLCLCEKKTPEVTPCCPEEPDRDKPELWMKRKEQSHVLNFSIRLLAQSSFPSTLSPFWKRRLQCREPFLFFRSRKVRLRWPETFFAEKGLLQSCPEGRRRKKISFLPRVSCAAKKVDFVSARDRCASPFFFPFWMAGVRP